MFWSEASHVSESISKQAWEISKQISKQAWEISIISRSPKALELPVFNGSQMSVSSFMWLNQVIRALQSSLLNQVIHFVQRADSPSSTREFENMNHFHEVDNFLSIEDGLTSLQDGKLPMAPSSWPMLIGSNTSPSIANSGGGPHPPPGQSGSSTLSCTRWVGAWGGGMEVL